MTEEPAIDKIGLILKALASKTNKFRVESLKEIVAFGEIVRPDFTCVKADRGQKRTSKPLFIVEQN
jgi:hypothetical protein